MKLQTVARSAIQIIKSLLPGLSMRDDINRPVEGSFFDYSVEDINGHVVNLNKYRGDVLLIVNTATGCGFSPQLAELEKLFQKYRHAGFFILGFPSNDFGEQEPGEASEIKNICELKYNVSFPLFKKISVSGSGKHPIYRFLTSPLEKGLRGEIGWNFVKILVNRRGLVVKRFSSLISPLGTEITKAIELELQIQSS